MTQLIKVVCLPISSNLARPNLSLMEAQAMEFVRSQAASTRPTSVVSTPKTKAVSSSEFGLPLDICEIVFLTLLTVPVPRVQGEFKFGS